MNQITHTQKFGQSQLASRHLVDRGLSGVQLIVSDACRGLMESVAEYLLDARWQRCVVHFYRNVFSLVPSTARQAIAQQSAEMGASSVPFYLTTDTVRYQSDMGA